MDDSDAMVSKLAAQGRTASALGAAGSFKEIGDVRAFPFLMAEEVAIRRTRQWWISSENEVPVTDKP